ncbi:MAG: hypothetical protein QXP59_06230, partial [Saccharolobus sp.]
DKKDIVKALLRDDLVCEKSYIMIIGKEQTIRLDIGPTKSLVHYSKGFPVEGNVENIEILDKDMLSHNPQACINDFELDMDDAIYLQTSGRRVYDDDGLIYAGSLIATEAEISKFAKLIVPDYANHVYVAGLHAKIKDKASVFKDETSVLVDLDEKKIYTDIPTKSPLYSLYFFLKEKFVNKPLIDDEVMK